MKVPIEVSARHVHLSKDHADILFGPDHKFKILKELSQPGQFAYEETVKLVGPKGEIDEVRYLGPFREQTQVEVSETGARKLGLDPPLRRSGDLSGSAGIKIVGPKGEVNLDEGVIIALRHIHIDPETAKKLGLKNGDKVKVDVDGIRDLVFENVIVRVSPNFRLAMHVDTDEANAAGLDEENHFGELVV
jgi:propanediol utilization protein